MTGYRIIFGTSVAICSLVFLVFILIGGLLMNKDFGIELSIMLVIVVIGVFGAIMYLLSREKGQGDNIPDRYTSNTSA